MGPACTHSENPMGIPSIPEPHTPFDLHHLIHVATKLQSFGRSIYRKSHNTSMDHYGSRNYNIFGWNPTHVSFWSCNNIICNYIVCLIAHETFEPTETWTIGTCNFSLPSEGINRHQVLKEHIHSTDIWLLQTTKWRKISLTHQEYIKQCFIFGWHPYLSPEASLANGLQTRWLWLYGVSCATMSHMCSLGWNNFRHKCFTCSTYNVISILHILMILKYANNLIHFVEESSNCILMLKRRLYFIMH